MCLDIRKECECENMKVQLFMRDNILLQEAVSRLFCPKCPGDSAAFNPETMVNDNGWIIEYDMVLARMLLSRNLQIDPEEVTPEFIFDQGYATWQEMYPGEQVDIKKERDELVKLVKEDQKKYLQAIQQWNIDRVAQLKTEGWRKVQMA